MKENFTLHAYADPKTYTVSFDTQGKGSEVEPQSLVYDYNGITNRAKQPQAQMTLDGYYIEGWYTDRECSGPAYNFNTPVESNFTLYANWQPIHDPYKFTMTVPAGKSTYKINIFNQNRCSVEIDWKDGTVDEYTDLSTGQHSFEHEYDMAVETQYIIEIKATNGSFLIGSGSANHPAIEPISSLTGVEFPIGATKTSDYAFANATQLTNTGLPHSATEISIGMYSGCTSLKEAPFSADMQVIIIGQDAFNGCSNITSITLPDTVKTIGAACFANCSSLADIHLSDSLVSLGARCFNGCAALKKINIPESLVSIQDYTFTNCSSLESIIIPESVTEIGQQVFNACTRLSSVVLLNKDLKVSLRTFAGCAGLVTAGPLETEANLRFA